MPESIRIEFPIAANSKLISRYNTIGDLKAANKGISIVKYMYIDPVDKILKCVNPPDDLPIVENAYITIVGETQKILQFMIDETAVK